MTTCDYPDCSCDANHFFELNDDEGVMVCDDHNGWLSIPADHLLDEQVDFRRTQLSIALANAYARTANEGN